MIYDYTDTMLRKRPSPQLPLSISFLLLSFVLASASPRNSTRRPGGPNPRLFGTFEDYDNIYEESLSTKATHKPIVSPPPLCQYDLCKDQQESCQSLALTLSCSCPGISGPHTPPDPPSIHSLSLESQGTVVVRWCAPPSTVTHYLVQVVGQDKAHKARENRRMMDLGDVAPGTEVCVEAVNRVGVSVRESHSCTRLEAGSSEARLAVKLVLIGVAGVLVLVIMVVLLLWWCSRPRKTSTRTANRRTDVVL